MSDQPPRPGGWAAWFKRFEPWRGGDPFAMIVDGYPIGREPRVGEVDEDGWACVSKGATMQAAMDGAGFNRKGKRR